MTTTQSGNVPARTATPTPASGAPVPGPLSLPHLVRQRPKWSEMKGLLNVTAPALTPAKRTTARLARAADVGDVRRIARRVTPTGPFQYVDSAASTEEAHRRNLAVFRDVELRPKVLRDVGDVDLSVDVLGRRSALPVGLAPTGFNRMMHAAGECAAARAAASRGVPFALSTLGTTSIEDVAAAAPDGRRWFQLYLWSQRRDESLALLERARNAGYDALIVTVDTATGGLRNRDIRNGLTIPPQISVKTVLDASYRPRWWFDFLTTEPLSYATLQESATSISVISSMFDPTLNYEDLEWIREAWQGQLIVKGVQTVDDARRCVDRGVDALYVSNHGGRQLDRAPVPLRELPGIREAVGPDVTLFLDSGITSGGDVLAALALGADFTLIGRAYLYGLMAGAQEGVERVLDILAKEMRVTMQLMGIRSVAELTPDCVRLDRGA
ncbi:MAG: alpha-hydroxy acid oxidase [Dermatophilus congolensis]|nr:alpha-hydroxy acid oxidase [Dermatophilus congolensis]